MPERSDKVSEELRTFVGRFLAEESNRTSLLTVTRVEVTSDLKEARIYVSVYPDDKEKPALDFLKRNLGEMRSYVMKESRIPRVPTLYVVIDQGEKNRQHIDQLVNEDKPKKK